jgi:hypothetical protein
MKREPPWLELEAASCLGFGESGFADSEDEPPAPAGCWPQTRTAAPRTVTLATRKRTNQRRMETGNGSNILTPQKSQPGKILWNGPELRMAQRFARLPLETTKACHFELPMALESATHRSDAIRAGESITARRVLQLIPKSQRSFERFYAATCAGKLTEFAGRFNLERLQWWR